jgi:hypothetical protein
MYCLNAQEYETYAGYVKKITQFEASEDTILKKCFSQDEMKLVGRLGC